MPKEGIENTQKQTDYEKMGIGKKYFHDVLEAVFSSQNMNEFSEKLHIVEQSFADDFAQIKEQKQIGNRPEGTPVGRLALKSAFRMGIDDLIKLLDPNLGKVGDFEDVIGSSKSHEEDLKYIQELFGRYLGDFTDLAQKYPKK